MRRNYLFTTILLFLFSVPVTAKELMLPITPQTPAEQFQLQTPQGESLGLDDFKGKYVLVNFWAHWCSPCIKEFPDMQRLYEQTDRESFEIIGIHAGPYSSEAAEFVTHFGITFPVVSDPDTSLKGWNVKALPMTYLVNPEGQLIYEAVGPREWDLQEMKALITN
ncbi:TlpA disulfide reductase family protein [Methylophaga thiooxydans]|uniref:TlpA disulfide reductase family protein n=1 Tax=Methylophaga thiooxydans TaxID=392484 RepID=UPI002352B0BC|nr:TlpA disulfide reductase family protein [Methylophaga thiooxydans]